MQEQLLYKPEAAAAALGIGRSTVYDLMRAGRLASVLIGRSRRIPRAELERYVATLQAEQGLASGGNARP